MNLKPFSLLILLLFFYSVGGQNIQLRITGDNSIETQLIDSLGYKKYHKNYRAIIKEVDTFSIKLDKIGYLENQVTGITKANDSLYEAKFNLKNRIKFIRVIDAQEIIDAKTRELFSTIENTRYLDIPIEQLESLMQRLNSDIAEKGKPFSFLQLSEFKAVNDTILSAQLLNNTSEERTIDKIIVKGYEKFPKSYIKRNLKIRTGQVFNLNQIERKSRKLKNIQFAKEIKSPEVLFTKDSTILYIYVEKVKQNVFDGFLGFGSNETTNKLEFDGYLNLSLTNNLNYGESFELYYKSDENEQKTFDASLSMPYILGSQLGVSLHLNIFKRDSSFLNTTQQAKLNYQFSAAINTGIGINSVISSNLLDTTISQIEDFESSFFLAEVNYLDTNSGNLLFPLKKQLQFSTDFGARTTDDFKDAQIKLRLKASNIFILNDRNSIYTNITAEHLDSDRYLENELPRFGGINSIRGFEENSLVANTYGVLNTEYRYQASSSLYIHSVIDAAYFENELANQKNKLFGFGFGFGLLTNAGLFKLTYATAKTENQKVQLNDSKVHLSLVATF